jgi:hypothetical protein
LVTVTFLLEYRLIPTKPNFKLAGDTEIAGTPALAAWMTFRVFPATVRVPVREEVLELAATEYTTVPFPDPLNPAVTVIQATSLEAVQGQPVAALTPALPGPPAAVMSCWVGLRV